MIQRAIVTLSEAQQQVIGLYYYEGLTIDAIAGVLQMKRNTVKSHLVQVLGLGLLLEEQGSLGGSDLEVWERLVQRVESAHVRSTVECRHYGCPDAGGRRCFGLRSRWNSLAPESAP